MSISKLINIIEYTISFKLRFDKLGFSKNIPLSQRNLWTLIIPNQQNVTTTSSVSSSFHYILPCDFLN